MQFANPIWLWGLSGLLIPIGIHLLSRKEGKIIKIGSIRHLEDTNTTQFKSIRLNEILLLVLRCMLIISLVFFLSGFHFTGLEKRGQKWLLIEKGLEHDQQFTFLVDSLKQNGFEIKLLAFGFPSLRDSMPTKEKINYWSLLEDLKTRSLDQVVILSYSYAERFKGKRIPLPANFQWISRIPIPVEFPLKSFRQSEDSVSLQLGHSDPEKTDFATRHIISNPRQRYFKYADLDSIPIEFPDTISIVIVSDSAFDYDKSIIMAALNALKENGPHVINIAAFHPNTYPEDQKTDWIIWLSDKPLSNPNKCSSIVYKNGADLRNTALFEFRGYHGNYSSLFLTKRVNEEIALQENLTVQLALILFSNEKYQDQVQKFDRRVLPEKIMWDATESSINQFNASTVGSNEKYIAILFLIFLLIERFVAFKRNQ